MWRESLVSNSLALKRKWWIGRWKKPLRGKVQERDFPTSLGNPARAAGFPLLPPPPRRLQLVDFLFFRQEEIADLRVDRLVCCLRGNGLNEQRRDQLFKYRLRPF